MTHPKISIEDAQKEYPQFKFLRALTPSAQKSAFHVQDEAGADLCLKIVAPGYGQDRLDREIIALQKINHPNVVHLVEYVFATREGQQQHYILEEFIEGDDLTEALKKAPWGLDESCDFFSKLCSGLAELARCQIVHRDLKPSNIRVRTNGSPVLIDFGLSRHLSLTDITPTDAGAQFGTPTYFAPEQFTANKRSIDHRTDLFAVGLLMHQALIGSHPFWKDGMTIGALCDAVCNSEDFLRHTKFMELPKEAKLLLKKLLEKSRGDRPHDAAHVVAILGKLRSQL